METERRFALEAVRRAALFTKRLQQDRSSQVFEKEDRSPVTIADFGAQLLVSQSLQQAFPDDRLVAEENILALSQSQQPVLDRLTALLSQSIEGFSIDEVVAREEALLRKTNRQRYWVLDPIDGTKGFLRGEQFAVALALIVDQQPVLGVLGCPNLNLQAEPDQSGMGIVAWAEKGRGAWIEAIENPGEPTRLSVSHCADAAQARFVSSLDSTGHSNAGAIAALKEYLNNTVGVQQFDSQAKYVMVAAGRYDLFVRQPPQSSPAYHEKVWDHAAGAVIVEEAGGRVTDLTGQPFDYSAGRSLEKNFGVLVTNGAVHEQVVSFFRQQGG
jgi:3'(2'), 5'-bisphosphate nucleotidase